MLTMLHFRDVGVTHNKNADYMHISILEKNYHKQMSIYL